VSGSTHQLALIIKILLLFNKDNKSIKFCCVKVVLPNVKLPAKYSFPCQSKVRALERLSLAVPFPTIST